VRLMCDEELIKTGSQIRALCGDVVSGGRPGVFGIERRICREEYGRRHPKSWCRSTWLRLRPKVPKTMIKSGCTPPQAHAC